MANEDIVDCEMEVNKITKCLSCVFSQDLETQTFILIGIKKYFWLRKGYKYLHQEA